MFPKNKENKQRQTKKEKNKRKIKEESYLNYTTIIKYTF